MKIIAIAAAAVAIGVFVGAAAGFVATKYVEHIETR